MKKDNTKALSMWNGWFRGKRGVPIYDAWLDDYSEELENHQQEKMLDLGCGMGADTLYLLERGYDVLF